jgi:hypothetical protein
MVFVEKELYAVVRVSVPGEIAVTLAGTLIEQPPVFVVGVLGLNLWTSLETSPFVYYLLTWFIQGGLFPDSGHAGYRIRRSQT